MLCNSDRILEDIAALKVVDDARTRSYIAALDRGMARILEQAAGASPAEVYFRSEDPRTITEGAGYMAFFYAFPRSRFYRDPRLLSGVREIIEDVLAHQLDTGELTTRGQAGVERPHAFPPHPYSSHGQSWYLEPLLLAMNWLAAEFSPAERQRIDRAFYRTADFICARPIYQVNNRAVIQCAILALCGRYFGEKRFLHEARRHFQTMPIQVFDPNSGQILEGSAPDGNYSGTTFEYLYIYRIMSGDVGIDRAMAAAVKWLSRVVDRNGWQMFCGAASRLPLNNSGMLYDFLPALERYSAAEPFFQTLIANYLPHLEAQGALGRPGHSISPTLWALLEHAEVTPPPSEPAWYSDVKAWYFRDVTGPEHFFYNEGYDHLYYPVRRAYSTCVAARGRPALKDLQAWSLAAEPPVIYPFYEYPYAQATLRASTVRTFGGDTAVQGASGCQMPDACWIAGEAPGLILCFGRVWRFYVFAPRTTLVLTAGEAAAGEIDWVADTAVCGTPESRPGCLCYPGRQGRLHFAGPPPAPIQNDGVLTFRFPFAALPVWFAFSDDSFRLQSFAGGQFHFRDADGDFKVRFETAPSAERDGGVFALAAGWRLGIARSAP